MESHKVAYAYLIPHRLTHISRWSVSLDSSHVTHHWIAADKLPIHCCLSFPYYNQVGFLIYESLKFSSLVQYYQVCRDGGVGLKSREGNRLGVHCQLGRTGEYWIKKNVFLIFIFRRKRKLNQSGHCPRLSQATYCVIECMGLFS